MKKGILALLLGFSLSTFSQELVSETFDDTRVVNGHSVETSKEGSMKFIIAHRFGLINGGLYELYGLDQSTIRLGFDYGLTDNITIGIGRSSFQKNNRRLFKIQSSISKNRRRLTNFRHLAKHI